MIHSSIDNFQPGLLPNSEQKADNIPASPAIANANVGGCRVCQSKKISKKENL